MPLINPRPALVLGASAAAVSCPADTSEDLLATVTIPAGIMGLNGILRIYHLWSFTSSANNKTPRVRLGGIGGTVYGSDVFTTSATWQDMRWIANRGAANSQIGGKSSAGILTFSTSSNITSSVDTSAATTLVFTGQKASAGETLTLEQYLVELLLPGLN